MDLSSERSSFFLKYKDFTVMLKTRSWMGQLVQMQYKIRNCVVCLCIHNYFDRTLEISFFAYEISLGYKILYPSTELKI